LKSNIAMWSNSMLLWFILPLLACGSNKGKILSETEKEMLMYRGDSITIEMQGVLLEQVSAAMKKGGADYAVDFCNVQAMPLTDSMSAQMNVAIQRLSDKNRNPDNALKTSADSLAWTKIAAAKTAFIEQDNNGAVYYYKPIMAAMPACLKCHGGQDDIAESTQKIIALKYPKDKATGYATGDLRGMWKIKMNMD